MKQEEKTTDPRISRRYFVFPIYLALFFAVGTLMMLPTVLYGGIHLIRDESGPYVKWYFIYCVVVTAVILSMFNLHKYMTVERPIRRLSIAAKKVAEGDFSVYLPLRHAPNDMDYIDTLYMDFNKMVAELGSIETLKNDFAANVSHEMKTPLSAINNYVQLLQGTELDAVQQEYADAILESTKRLSSLIFNVLKLNKLESQKIQPKPERYDLCGQLAECAIGFEAVWEKKGIEFEADMEECAYVEADRELMGLVWNNFLSNAFKFTDAGGTVGIRQYSDQEYITVEVSDTGCGMSEQTMKRMFDKFYQGDTSHATEGNGLGLSLILRILQMSGGTITVKSAEEKGTVFHVRFPVSPVTEKEQEGKEQEVIS